MYSWNKGHPSLFDQASTLLNGACSPYTPLLLKIISFLSNVASGFLDFSATPRIRSVEAERKRQPTIKIELNSQRRFLDSHREIHTKESYKREYLKKIPRTTLKRSQTHCIKQASKQVTNPTNKFLTSHRSYKKILCLKEIGNLISEG